ncbi:DUF943 family protein [Enterobacteriaceae bacterium LUAb1]
MKIKGKIYSSVLLIIACIVSYFLWSSMRSVEIIAVHHRESNFSDILVRHFPFTDKGKITWWLENKSRLEKEFNIPDVGPDGFFYITFWNFGDGYKEEGKYDRLCFDDMKTKINCIEKDAVFSVNTDREKRIFFTVYDGTYLMKKQGEIIKIKRQVR